MALILCKGEESAQARAEEHVEEIQQVLGKLRAEQASLKVVYVLHGVHGISNLAKRSCQLIRDPLMMISLKEHKPFPAHLLAKGRWMRAKGLEEQERFHQMDLAPQMLLLWSIGHCMSLND